MGRQGPGAQALDPQAAPRQKAARPLANHPFAVHGQHCLPAADYWRVPRPSSAWADTSYWLFATGYRLLATPYWLLPTPYSLPYSLLPTPYSLLTTLYSLLATLYSLLATAYSLLTIGGCPVQAPLGRDTRTTPYWLPAVGYWRVPRPSSAWAGYENYSLLTTPYCLLAGAPSKLRLGGIRELLSTPYWLLLAIGY
jgi:hypothetical protein